MQRPSPRLISNPPLLSRFSASQKIVVRPCTIFFFSFLFFFSVVIDVRLGHIGIEHQKAGTPGGKLTWH